MNSKERVRAVIEKREFDRLPIYGWLKENLEDEISAEFGSLAAFEDRYEFDFAHIFGGPTAFDVSKIAEIRKTKGEVLPSDMLELALNDPNDTQMWKAAKAAIDFYGGNRQRFTYMQTPGIFEALNTNRLGIENHMMYMALYPEDMKRLYEKQSKWNLKFAMNALDLGVDMIHVSDDWGAQRSLLFNPKLWHEMIAPNHKRVIDAVHKRGAYASLHSDGNINQVLDGIADLGYDVIHPYQVSAGMSYDVYFDKYSDKFTIMGGIDIQTTLGFGRFDDVKAEIDNIVNRFKKRGLMLCTSHYVQNHCTVDELVFAYDYIYKKIRE